MAITLRIKEISMYRLWEGIECFVPKNKIAIYSGLEGGQKQGDVIEDYRSGPEEIMTS